MFMRSVALAGVMCACIYSPAQALTLNNLVFLFDDADDLLQLSGDVTSTSLTGIQAITFDWDGVLDSFDDSAATLISGTPSGSLVPGSGTLSVEGLAGAPLTSFSFNYLIKLPGAGAAFLSEPIDINVHDANPSQGSFGTDSLSNVGTPVAADLTAVPLPASGFLLLGGVAAAVGALKRKVRN